MRDCELCNRCFMLSECGTDCMAMQKLKDIYKETRSKDRYQLIKKLQKELSIRDAEPNKDMRKLAESILRNDAILEKFPELCIIPEYDIKVGYVLSQDKPVGSKIKYADCEKVKLKYQAWLPYDFIITFYEPNTELLSENQKKILMVHELKHIGIGERGFKLEEHDIEDFENILRNYGIKWNGIDQDVPDILSEDIERNIVADVGNELIEVRLL